MPQKPTVPQLDWVPSNSGVRVEPSGSKKNQGWSPLEPLPAQNENWILYSIDQWIKYLERVTDSLFLNSFTVGTAQDVEDGNADFDDIQDAYDAANDNGGGTVIVLPGTILGDLNANSTAGILIRGSGYDSVISGNVNVTGTRNIFKDLRISGELEIDGAFNVVDVHHSNNSFYVWSDSLNNSFTVRRESAMVQTINFSGPATDGSVQILYRGALAVTIVNGMSAADVQTALRLVNGLGACTVTGSYALGYTVTLIGGVEPLVIGTNTLADVTWAFDTWGIYGGPFDPSIPSIQADVGTQQYRFYEDFDNAKSSAYILANASAATIQAAIRAIPGGKWANVIVTQPGGANLFPVRIQYVGVDDPTSLYYRDGTLTAGGGGVQLNKNNNDGSGSYESAPIFVTTNVTGEPSGLVKDAGEGRVIFLTSASLTLTAQHNGCILKKMANIGMLIDLPPPMKDFRFILSDGTNRNNENPIEIGRSLAKIGGLAENFIFDAQTGSIEFYCDGTNWFII